MRLSRCSPLRMIKEMKKSNIEDIYPLSPAQQGILFHTLQAAQSGVYIEQLILQLQALGPFQETAFRRAWQHVLTKHPALRTAFVWEKQEKAVQVVLRDVQPAYVQEDWRHLTPTVQAQQLDSFLRQDRSCGFELTKAPLLRLALFQIEENLFQAVATFHHIIKDGWSGPLILSDLLAFYEAERNGQLIPAMPVHPYRNYISWLQKQEGHLSETYWREALRGFTTATPFQIDSPGAGTGQSSQQKRQLSEALTTRLTTIARQHQLTLNTLIQGAWALLLTHYSGETDVVFGVVLSGRPPELLGAAETVGLFINTLPLRTQVDPSEPLLSWLQKLQTNQVAMRTHEFSALAEVHGWSSIPHNQPLFESIVVFENYPFDTATLPKSKSLIVHSVQSVEQTNYPLTVVALPGPQLTLMIDYENGRFTDDCIIRMIDHLEMILNHFAEDLTQPLDHIPFLTQLEQQLLNNWNKTEFPYPLGQGVHELFAHQVQKTPTHTAVIDTQQQLTYYELDERANQLAHYLRKWGISSESRVGIYTERSAEMVVGLLGVLKAGGAFVPLDPTYPPERLALMVKDANVSLLLTQQPILTTQPVSVGQDVRILCLDVEQENISQESTQPLLHRGSGTNLAYIIYTSGSTGQPKGILMPHYGLGSMANAQIAAFSVAPDKRVLQFASFSFDVAITEILMALLCGGTLVLAPSSALLPGPGLVDLLQQQRITTITVTPSVLKAIPYAPLPHLETIIAVGEPCPPDLMRLWGNGRRFLNAYGPSETVCATIATHVDPAHPRVVGRPMANTKIYLCDTKMQLVPIGIPGEVYVQSVSIARGYQNNPRLTAQQFVPNPFSDSSDKFTHSTLYKTGDLARYLPDGRVEFLGRIDHQVKVRGMRIELGEIENALRIHPGVRDCVVLLYELPFGEKQLTAYVVPQQTPGPSSNELRRFLGQTLPINMIPAAFISLPHIPLTPNGKVDRKALPDPPPLTTHIHHRYVPPDTPDEEKMVAIWTESLQLEKVGITDNFWELGGHSLLGTKIISRVQKAFQIDVPLRALFETQTVRELTAYVQTQRQNDQTRSPANIKRVQRDTPLALSLAQERIWFLHQLMPENPLYNITTAVSLTGPLDISALEQSVNSLIQRHEALRTTFITREDQPVQVIQPPFSLSIMRADLRHLPPEAKTTQAQQLAQEQTEAPFDLVHGPLIRASLVQMDTAVYHFYLTMHHIISDGWSMGVLLREIAQIYQAVQIHQMPPLSELSVQYADYAIWQRQYLQKAELAAQTAYWQQQLTNLSPLLLPTDFPRSSQLTFTGRRHYFTLSHPLTRALRAISQAEETSLFTVLLTAFQIQLFRYTGQNDIVVGSPIANRHHLEIEDVIGFFVNTLILRSDVSGNPDFRTLLQRIHKMTTDAYAHQDLPFAKLVEIMQPERDMSRNPLFQVAFVYQNAPMPPLALGDVTLSLLDTKVDTLLYDLELHLWEDREQIRGYITYNTALFSDETIQRMGGHLETLLHYIAINPGSTIAQLPLLTENERVILQQWNARTQPLPTETCWQHLFETQVEKTPAAVAVSFAGTDLTYAALNGRANQLAHYLQQQGVGLETPVGLCMDRSLDMIVGLLGILKAGAVYVPLDPAYPSAHLSFILNDAQATMLLTQSHLQHTLSSHHLPTICLDTDWTRVAAAAETNPDSLISPGNLAYIIYTSGSTGKPKGVLVPHCGLVNVSQIQKIMFPLQPGSRVLQFSSLNFDASIFEIVMALGQGATLCLSQRETLMPGPSLNQFLQETAVNLVTLPPSALPLMPPDEIPSLTTITVAGEACASDLVEKWAAGRAFFNLYGPTETTIWATAVSCSPGEGTPPIGRPIPNSAVYILDAHLQPVPIGVPGELYIGGVGVSRGYLNQPKLTAQQFLPNPFTSDSGTRMYKTGDRGRYLSDGNIQFLGRADQQIKLRGFRIEPGEIESTLKLRAHIKEAVVIMREDTPGDKRLVAYVVAHHGETSTSAELRSFLQKTLPPHMIPSHFVWLDGLPLTLSGKIDRQCLPAPEQKRSLPEQTYIAPRSEMEQTIATIWQQYLGVAQVGVNDNFFELGGHSLLLVQVQKAITTALSREITLTDLFKYSTVASLAKHLSMNPQHLDTLQDAKARASARHQSLHKRQQHRGKEHS